METFSALLALRAGNSPVTGEFPSQRPVTRSFDVFFDLRLNKRLSKQSWCWWLETQSRSLWRQCNGHGGIYHYWITTLNLNLNLIFSSTVCYGYRQRSVTCLLWVESDRDRWILPTKGQKYEKRFHAMASSCHNYLYIDLVNNFCTTHVIAVRVIATTKRSIISYQLHVEIRHI